MKYLKILMLGLVLLPITVNALDKKDYKSMNLEEALQEEKLEYDLSNYTENDNQITIYLFRGNGCSVCRKFLTFLNSIVPEYGQYFKLESYEVWYNSDNTKLYKKVAAFMEEQADGVPFIVIGDVVFPGYSEHYDDAIKAAIKKLYNEKDRYDVFTAMNKAEKASKVKYPLIFTIDGSILVISGIGFYLNHEKTKSLNERIAKLEKTIDALRVTKEKPKKETVKKETKEKPKTKKPIVTKKK